MTDIYSLEPEAVASFVGEANEILKRDHASWHEFVNSVKFHHPIDPALDPKSQVFADEQMKIWEIASGRDRYDADDCERNEHIAIESSIQQIYPFSSANAKEVGNYFIGCGNIIKHLDLPRGSKVVELGIGYGNVTRLMANFGYEVTAADIEPRFLDLLDDFPLKGASPIEKVQASFDEFQIPAGTIDGVVFFECFHHCLKHIDLLDKVSACLRPNGRILFAAEAFYDDWFDWPWGVRLDGHSVWAIRNFGWMELGFRKSYITEILTARGFSLAWSSVPEAGPYGEMLVATLAR